MVAPMYAKAVLYVMSGTGNTHRVGCWMQEHLRQHHTRTDLVMIEDADVGSDLNPSAVDLVGLLFPTHGFMPPWSMIKFMLRMPKRTGMPVVCVATRGGLKFGPLYIPGVAGLATFLGALLMVWKGYRLKAVFSLDMPSNLINLHWGLHPKNVATISDRSKIRLKHLMDRIMDDHRILFTRNNLWEMAWCVLLFGLVPIFPILYLMVGRMFMAKVMFSNNRCVGCGMCARFCPNNAILMKTVGSRKRPYWTYHCENCMRCMGYCRKKAVEAGHSWAVLLYLITALPVVSYALAGLNRTFSFVPVISGYWTIQLISIVYILPSLFLSYWLFWQLIRFPLVNSVFTYTTLTHYFRRYHHPDTKLKHMARPSKLTNTPSGGKGK